MFYDLIAVADFSPYKTGDKITDPATIAAIEASEKYFYCVQVLRDATDAQPPIVTTVAAQYIAENSPFSLTLVANEPNVIWAKVGGADAALFTLTGAVLTMAAKDFENPSDANGDNGYVVQVQATDAAGNDSGPFTITVTVTNLPEGVAITSTPTVLIALGAL